MIIYSFNSVKLELDWSSWPLVALTKAPEQEAINASACMQHHDISDWSTFALFDSFLSTITHKFKSSVLSVDQTLQLSTEWCLWLQGPPKWHIPLGRASSEAFGNTPSAVEQWYEDRIVGFLSVSTKESWPLLCMRRATRGRESTPTTCIRLI